MNTLYVEYKWLRLLWKAIWQYIVKVENALTSVTQQFDLFTLEKLLHMCRDMFKDILYDIVCVIEKLQNTKHLSTAQCVMIEYYAAVKMN